MLPARRRIRVKPVVIVAGAGPGIGAAVARAFGGEGFAIALLARDSARLAKRHAEITAAGITAAPFIVERGTPFDPDNIAAALVRLHRGTNEGVEIHFSPLK